MAFASTPACSAPNPSAAGLGTSLVVGLSPASAAALSSPAASVLTRSAKGFASAYGAGDGAEGYAGFVAASSAPSLAPGAASPGFAVPGGNASSHRASKSAPSAMPASRSIVP